VPYFWSDQYDLKLQVYGLPGADQGFDVVEGSLAERRFIGVYHHDGIATAALGCGLPHQLRTWRQRVAAAASLPERL
jgi:hypothetical protein